MINNQEEEKRDEEEEEEKEHYARSNSIWETEGNGKKKKVEKNMD